MYNECLSQLIQHRPANLCPIFTFLKQIGESIKKRMNRKASEHAPIIHTVDSFYVLYILSSGVVDDAKELIKLISRPEWSSLPVQVHLVTLHTDKFTRDLQKQMIKVNTRHSKWPQFLLHSYDDMKFFYQTEGYAMDRLRNDTVIRTVRDIESFLFVNRLDLQRFQHNKALGNTTQSQQYIMDLIDQKFERLKDQIYKLGISPV